jgi:prepilin-type N-terminal cleavage/methylation domain-containing protein
MLLKENLSLGKRKTLTPKGFTLLEVVIAVFLLALIALVCAMALNIGITTYEKQQKHASDFEAQTINYYRLFEQLKHLCAYKGQGGKKYDFFKGDSEHLEFISSLSLTQPGMPGFFRVEYSFEEGKLWIRERRILDTSYLYKDWEEEEEKKEFLSELASLSFQYFDGQDWQEEWKKGGLPKAIKIKIEKKKTQFSFIVPLLIGEKFKF